MSVEVIELFNLFPELPELLQRAVARATQKAAFDIQAQAARLAPVDTGFLKSSLYVVTRATSTYAQGADQPPQGAELLPEVERPRSPTVAYIAVGASYGIYPEFGTVNTPAQPYLTPAAELVYPQYLAALKALHDEMEFPIPGGIGGGGASGE